MPRRIRVDAPGAIHHVVARSVERSRIFCARSDYEDMLNRLGRVLGESGGTCCAWAMMPNHVHLVVRTGRRPLSRIMHRVLLGYTAAHNSKLNRTGHLFEGRYKSILVEEAPHLLELIRYVHLNPLRSGLVSGLRGLARYSWSGHRVLLGYAKLPWQEVGPVLKRFGSNTAEARRKYIAFLEDGVDSDENLKGESLKRVVEGGWEMVKDMLKPGGRGANESIMGSDRFIKGVLDEAEERERRKSEIRRKISVTDVLDRAAKEAGIPREKVKGPSKLPACCRARALACYWLVDVLGFPEVQVALKLGIVQSAVSINVPRGKRIAEEEKLKIMSGSR